MEALGLDLKILIAQIINFAIVLFILKKFLYTPILGMLEERKSKIEQGMKDSNEAKELLAKVETESDQKKEKAYKDAALLIENAKKEATEKSLSIIQKANDQAEQIIKRAEEEANKAKKEALNEARSELGNLISLALEKIVGDELSDVQKKNLTIKAVKEL